MVADNNRIFYACQAVAISPCPNNNNFVETHGVQSVGVNTSFNLEQAFELGQISIYENIEGLPEVEVTLEKVLDGYPLLYRLATMPVADPNPREDDLVGRTKNRCCVALAIYPDSLGAVSGAPQTQVYMSGMYLNAVNYTFPTDGNCTESVTLVGNHKEWKVGNPTADRFGTTQAAFYKFGNDKPLNNQTGFFKGGIQRRENVIMMSSVLPSSIYGVGRGTGSAATSTILGTGNNWRASLSMPIVHIQNITIGADMGRDDILELGQKLPYYRAAKFPVEVTSEFEVISLSGDFINALEKGSPVFVGLENEGNNTSEETISIMLQDGTKFDLGKKNRLSAVTYGGGDAGGGNASLKYSYSTFNDLTITPPHATGTMVGQGERGTV